MTAEKGGLRVSNVSKKKKERIEKEMKSVTAAGLHIRFHAGFSPPHHPPQSASLCHPGEED